MNLSGIADVVEGVKGIADDLSTTDQEQLKIAIGERKPDTALLQNQLAINLQEARHGGLFVAGWRPFIGWIGGFALAYQFLLYPVLIWIWAIGQAAGWIPCHLDSSQTTGACTLLTPPVFDSGPLFAIITGMLGIGGLRSYDKLKNTDTRHIGKPPSADK